MIRPAYLAGAWYPASDSACRTEIEGFLTGAPPFSGDWRALIGPHAGWRYSGAVAARTYQSLAQSQPKADLVVVFGSHRGPHGPDTVFLEEAWDTPLGAAPNAQNLAAEISRSLALREEPAQSSRPDNGVELHLPMVRYFFPEAQIVMVGVAARVEAEELGKKVGSICQQAGHDAVFVGSTDLTHYGPDYGFVPQGTGPEAVAWVRDQNDAAYLQQVLGGDISGSVQHALDHQSACCPGAVAACMAAARNYAHQGTPELIAHTLSYDLRPAASYVGYGGLVL